MEQLYVGFIIGAAMMREMLARFVEQGGDPVIAQSMRANWNPTWCPDPGAPPEETYESFRNRKLTSQ